LVERERQRLATEAAEVAQREAAARLQAEVEAQQAARVAAEEALTEARSIERSCSLYGDTESETLAAATAAVTEAERRRSVADDSWERIEALRRELLAEVCLLLQLRCARSIVANCDNFFSS
jgi:hypothetical protein